MTMNGQARAQVWRLAGLQVARELAAEAVWSDGVCAFHGATSPASIGQPPRFRSMGGDLYEGSAGIARFLGMAAAVSGDAALKTTALGALRHACSNIDGWALFSGGMGIGLVALELAQRLDEPDLVASGARIIEQASLSAQEAGSPYDLLAGTAGVIVGLAAARHCDTDERWRTRACDLGRALLAAAVHERSETVDGAPLSWPLAPTEPMRLCGLAHGASGMALAFEALSRLAPDESGWASAARRARAFERSHYCAEHGSWADLRPHEAATQAGPTAYPHMWCHGSIGVAAERLGAVNHDLFARADAVGGLAGARGHARRLLSGPVGPAAGDAVNVSLCHGLAGLVDLFIDTWSTSGDTSWMALAAELGDLMLNDARRGEGWRSGVPGGWPAPGLMLGKAGAGWAMLRLAEPEHVPSGWRVGPPGPRPGGIRRAQRM